MPHSSWQTQKAAVSCFTAAVETHPDLAYTLLDILESTVGKVSVRVLRPYHLRHYNNYMLQIYAANTVHCM